MAKNVVVGVASSQEAIRTGRTSISNGANSVVITFVPPFSSVDYSVTCDLQNIVDSPASQYAYTITSKSLGTFTVQFSGNMDSANYVLEWIITPSTSVTDGLGFEESKRYAFMMGSI